MSKTWKEIKEEMDKPHHLFKLVDKAINEKAARIDWLENRVKELEEQLSNINDTCPHCGTTELLCGYNGPGCSSEPDEEDDDGDEDDDYYDVMVEANDSDPLD